MVIYRVAQIDDDGEVGRDYRTQEEALAGATELLNALKADGYAMAPAHDITYPNVILAARATSPNRPSRVVTVDRWWE